MGSKLSSFKLALTPVAFAAALASGLPASVLAQTAPAATAGGESQTIEVTARRRVESQLEVPASVTSISGEGLKATGAVGVGDIIAQVPNANLTENPRGFDTYISIRGMRQADVGAEPNFGMYRNGIFAGGHRVNLGSQVDVDRVEIVRGPQGGLYGRDAVGGAVNVIYVMPKPGDKASGYATLGVENTGVRLEGAATVPLGENTAMRGTVWGIDNRKGDYYNATLGKEIDRARDAGVRLSLASNITPALSSLLTFEMSKSDTPALRTYASGGVANGGFAGLIPPVLSDPETPRTVRQDTDSRNDIAQTYLAGKLAWEVAGGTLSLLGSVRDYKLDALQDQDQTALPLDSGVLVLAQEMKRKEDIQQRYLELLWESDPQKAFSWRAGVSYFSEDFGLSQAVSGALDTTMFTGFPPPLGGLSSFGVVSGVANLPADGSGYTVKSWSAFADARYEFSKTLAATFTLRRTVDEQRLRWMQGIDPSSHPVAAALFAGVIPSLSLDSVNKYSFTSPSAGLEIKVDKDTHAYVLYGTGFRPGGYNTTVSTPDYIPYGQESARSIEAGLKMQFLGGRAAMNLSVFRMDQKDLMVQQDDPNDTQFGFTYLANVGKARTTGMEFELLGRVDRAWTLGFSVGHLSAKYTEGLVNAGTAAEVDVTGRPLQGVRPWTINARADYKGAIAGREFTAGLSVRRESGGYIGDQSQEALEALTKLDMYAGIDIMPKTRLGAYVRNALDEQVIAFRFLNGAAGTTQGRRFGLQLTHRF